MFDNLKHLQDYWLIKRSSLFDAAYYLNNNQDVRKANINPLMHFVRHGWREGRNPSQLFNTKYYLSQNQDVRNEDINPLIHFLLSGRFENRAPKPKISNQDSKNYKGLKEAWIIRFVRYLKHGKLKSQDQQSVYLEWRNARKKNPGIPGGMKYRPGINIVSYIRTAKGIAEAARSNILALQTTNIDYSILDYKVGIPTHQLTEVLPDSQYKGKFLFNTNLFHINPPQLPHLWETFNKTDLTGRYNIGVWYWELPEFPEEWCFAFSLVDEVWVASQFVMDSISAKSPVPVVKIPPCIHIDIDTYLKREDFNLPTDRFLFLCAYDVLSTQARKNPYGAIKAFKRAFPKNDSTVGLVIKVSNAQENPAEVKRLREEFQDDINVYFIEEILNRTSMNSLINLVDAFISLHRSEGFGLVPAEAMYLGKPVIMTRWSGNLEFMTQDNSCGVDYELLPIKERYGPYAPGQIWADPDLDQAAFYMQRLHTDTTYYAQISEQARKDIHSRFSPEVVGKLIQKRMTKIGLI